MVKEELDLLQRFYKRLDERVAADAPEEERKAAAFELVEEDEEMAALWERLEELSRGNDESLLASLRELDRKERAEGEDPSAG